MAVANVDPDLTFGDIGFSIVGTAKAGAVAVQNAKIGVEDLADEVAVNQNDSFFHWLDISTRRVRSLYNVSKSKLWGYEQMFSFWTCRSMVGHDSYKVGTEVRFFPGPQNGQGQKLALAFTQRAVGPNPTEPTKIIEVYREEKGGEK